MTSSPLTPTFPSTSVDGVRAHLTTVLRALRGSVAWNTCTQGVLGGKPCVRGTRISVEFLLERLANGATPEAIAAHDEDVPVEAEREAIRYRPVRVLSPLTRVQGSAGIARADVRRCPHTRGLSVRTLPLPVPSLLLLSALLLPACGGDKAVEGANPGECADGADNDGDSAFDCDDDDCAGAPDCGDAASDTADTAATNAAPSGVSIAIAPATPGPDDALSCTVVTEAVDPDGDTVTYRYAWTVDGASAGLAEATVASSLTEGGQTWTCTVTPTDGALDGTPASASVTITQANRAPSAPTVSIVPAAPTDDDALNCVISGESVDPDGDAVSYAYSWTVNGAGAGLSSAVVTADRTRAGETWACSVIGSDGTLTSAAGVASVTVVAACDDDGDGHDKASCGGDDCDDSDAGVYPRAGDTYGDGVDGDCDGLDCEAGETGGAYFVACTTGMTESDAETFCTDAGYDGLASIRTVAEDNAVVTLLLALPYAGTEVRLRQLWLGTTDVASEGRWVWSDGATSSYTSWLAGEPNGGTGENCAILTTDSAYEWIDVPCSRPYYAPLCGAR